MKAETVRRYAFYHSNGTELGMQASENPAGKWVLYTDHLAALSSLAPAAEKE